MKPIEVNAKSVIDDQQIFFLAVTAIENGSGYWAKVAWSKERDDRELFPLIRASTLDDATKREMAVGGKGETVHLYAYTLFAESKTIVTWFDEEDKEQKTAIGRSDWERAFTMLAASEKLSRHWKDITEDNWDSITADVLFQLVVLNEVKFG